MLNLTYEQTALTLILFVVCVTAFVVGWSLREGIMLLDEIANALHERNDLHEEEDEKK